MKKQQTQQTLMNYRTCFEKKLSDKCVTRCPTQINDDLYSTRFSLNRQMLNSRERRRTSMIAKRNIRNSEFKNSWIREFYSDSWIPRCSLNWDDWSMIDRWLIEFNPMEFETKNEIWRSSTSASPRGAHSIPPPAGVTGGFEHETCLIAILHDVQSGSTFPGLRRQLCKRLFSNYLRLFSKKITPKNAVFPFLVYIYKIKNIKNLQKKSPICEKEKNMYSRFCQLESNQKTC